MYTDTVLQSESEFAFAQEIKHQKLLGSSAFGQILQSASHSPPETYIPVLSVYLAFDVTESNYIAPEKHIGTFGKNGLRYVDFFLGSKSHLGDKHISRPLPDVRLGLFDLLVVLFQTSLMGAHDVLVRSHALDPATGGKREKR
jgi:hypothetical protein